METRDDLSKSDLESDVESYRVPAHEPLKLDSLAPPKPPTMAPFFAAPNNVQRVKRLMRAASWTEPIRKAFEIDLVNLDQDRHHSPLNDLVLQGCNA